MVLTKHSCRYDMHTGGMFADVIDPTVIIAASVVLVERLVTRITAHCRRAQDRLEKAAEKELVRVTKLQQQAASKEARGQCAPQPMPRMTVITIYVNL